MQPHETQNLLPKTLGLRLFPSLFPRLSLTYTLESLAGGLTARKCEQGLEPARGNQPQRRRARASVDAGDAGRGVAWRGSVMKKHLYRAEDVEEYMELCILLSPANGWWVQIWQPYARRHWPRRADVKQQQQSRKQTVAAGKPARCPGPPQTIP
ncbi:hypothetical protein D9Q98_000029 [Chlorella vulgaris]|uniref:Uncharacterized protein n=1 Tax=Chlorella vulgaris TaxID=3077 RepID=A0A9D4Z1S5_CHLVU|nr:hypothetical protein D9Q98_000029 [Chlorella vulgaris]